MTKDMKKMLMAKISRNISTPAESSPTGEVEPTVSPILENMSATVSVASLPAVNPVASSSNVPIAEISVAMPPVVFQQPLQGLSQPLTKVTAFTGKQAAFWLNDEDRAIFNELVILLRSQGVKASENLVLRAALRMVPKDYRLVEKIRELMQNDGRKLRHTASQASGN